MKKYIFFLFLIVLALGHSFEDSLKSEMKFSSGKKLVNQYLELVKYYRDESPGKGVKVAREAIELARQHKSESLGLLYLYLNQLYSELVKNDSAFYYNDLAMEFYLDRNDTLGISQTYINRGVNFDVTGNSEEALKCYQKAREISEEKEFDEILAAVHVNTGDILLREGKYSDALKEYLNALAIDQKLNIPKNITESYVNLGKVLIATNNYEKATDYFYKALEIAEGNINKNNLIKIYDQLSLLFKLKKDYRTALIHVDKAIDLAKKLELKYYYSEEVLDKIDLLLLTKDYDLIEDLLKQVQLNLYTLDAPGLAANLYDVKCRYSIAKDEFKHALNFHNITVELLQNHYYTPERKLKHQIRLGKIKAHLGESEEAIKIIFKVIEQSNGIENLEIKVKAYEELYQIFEKKNDFENAFLHLRHFTEYSDTLLSLYNKSNIEELEIIHRMQKQNQESELIKKEKMLVDSQVKIQRTIITTFLFLTLISGFVVVYVSKSLISKRKNNKKLQKQNDTIMAQKAELEKNIASKDRLYSIIGHDLYNAHSNIASFINVLKRNLSRIDKKFIESLTNELEVINKSSIALLDTLVEWGKIQTKKQNFNPQKFNLKAFTHTNVMLFNKNLEEKKINLNNKIDSSLEIIADKNMIGSIVRNVISNAIKFTPENGTISVYSSMKNKNLELRFQDTGIGIEPEILKKLFMIENTVATKGTSGEKGHGLGLIICKELVELHKGEIFIESELDEGTTVKIILPNQQN